MKKFILLLALAAGLAQAQIINPPTATLFTQAGTGAVPRTFTSKGRDIVSVSDFGAKCDGTTDDTTAIQNAIAAVIASSGGGVVNVPPGTCKITRPLALYSDVTLRGSGIRKTIIKKTTNTVGTLGSIASPNGGGINDNFNVDAVAMIVHPASQYAYRVFIQDLELIGNNSNTYALYAPRVAQSAYERIYLENVLTGFYTYNSFLVSYRTITAQAVSVGFEYADDGTHGGTGTSATFSNVWINFDNTINQPLYGYHIYGLTYSTFTNVAADNMTRTDGAGTIPIVWLFGTAQNISLIGCGAENGTGMVIQAFSSRIHVTSFRSISMKANSGWGTAGTLWNDGSFIVYENSQFGATSPGTGIFNQVIQTGGVQTEIESVMPTGGNGFIGYGGSSQRTKIASGVISVINAGGTTLPVMTSTGAVVTNANLTGGVTSVGNAATVVTNANLTGDVTSVGNATTIATTGVSAGAYSTVTVNTKGQVTSAVATPTLATSTLAGLPAASGATNQSYRVTDVGNNGSVWTSNGTNWNPNNGVIQLHNNGLPRGIPSSGVFADNGALTLTTALNTTYGNVYLYFPANAICSGSAAGLYYTVMSSTTVGTVYNNTYSSGVATIPGSPTVFSCTGSGAYVQTTGAYVTMGSFTIPANVMGLNGRIENTTLEANNNSAGSKFLKWTYAGTAIFVQTQTTTTSYQSTNTFVANEGATNAQILGNSFTAGINTTADTTATQVFTSQAQLAVATDWSINLGDFITLRR